MGDLKAGDEEKKQDKAKNTNDPDGSMGDLKAIVKGDPEMEQLGTRLSTFLAKAEKGKQQQQQQQQQKSPALSPAELDLHTSWSDFDPDDIPDTASRVSTASRRGGTKRSALVARQEQLVQQAITTAQRDMGMVTTRPPSQRNLPQPEESSSSSSEQEEILQQGSASKAVSEEQPVQAATLMEKDEEEKDLESGLVGAESRTLDGSNKKRWRTMCLIASLILAVVLLILAFVLGY